MSTTKELFTSAELKRIALGNADGPWRSALLHAADEIERLARRLEIAERLIFDFDWADSFGDVIGREDAEDGMSAYVHNYKLAAQFTSSGETQE